MPLPAQVSLNPPSPSPLFTGPRMKCISGQEGQEGTLLWVLLLGGHGVGTRGWYWSQSPLQPTHILGM